MRIVSEWNNKDIKATAFVMNERYSVKFEKDLLEQWYKFRDGQIENPNQIQNLFNETFYLKLNLIFSDMHNNRLLLNFAQADEDEFDHII